MLVVHFMKLLLPFYLTTDAIGKEWVQFFGRECVTLPQESAGKASSLDTHRACVSVCQDESCSGPCHKLFSNQGAAKLRLVGFNDNIRSLKSCY
jgi:hypothetical protein